MFKHSLLLTFRHFKRYKSSFFINLIGLSTGLACALLIFLWVNDEFSVDKFHENDSRLYQVLEHREDPNSPGTNIYTAGLLAETLAEEMPEVEYGVATSLMKEPKTLSVEDSHIKVMGQYASKDFFNAFSYQIIQGDKDQVLSDKNAIVISETLAMNLFKTTENIIGKTIEFQHNKHFMVSGVFKETPPNSSVQFDFVLSFEEYKEVNPTTLDWDYSSSFAYLLLKKGSSIEQFNEKIAHFLNGKRGDSYTQNLTISARPYSNAYLYSPTRFENGEEAGGRIEYVRLFSIIAIFILFIACINFMNLSTAKASRRIKEIGIKKTVGAGRKTLVFQYLGESMLMAFLSLILALLLVMMLLPHFNGITGKKLSLVFDLNLVISLLTITLLTGLIAGSYPALYLSGFKPAIVMKGVLSSSTGELWTRKGLVIFQFTLSVILIVSVLVVYKQLEYVQTRNLGYNKDNILYFEIEGKVEENLETFLSEVKNIPGIVNASSIGQSVVGGSQNTFPIDHWEGKEPDEIIAFEMRPVNYDMIEMLGVKMHTGRTYSRDFSAEDGKIIFNEAAIDAMRLEDPIGKIITIQGTNLEIVGVTKNFHFASLHEEVAPLFFILRPSWTHEVMVKTEAGREREAIAALQQFYQDYNPGFTFDYKFLDTEYQAQYVAEQRVSTLSRYFAGIAIVISCLGLYGLVAFSAEQRRKEIGIRKVLGASVSNVMALLSKDFLKLVFIAIVVGSVLSWIAMTKWLEGFAYRIELGWWVFALAGAAALLIAICTVSYQALKAASANPVKNLRTE